MSEECQKNIIKINFNNSLCFEGANNLGDICTLNCPNRSRCTKEKTSFLIPTTDVLASEVNSERFEDLYVTTFKPYAIANESHIDDVTNFTYVACFNPYCSNLKRITFKQKYYLHVQRFKQYGEISPAVYCSPECQEYTESLLAESKFFEKGTIKNRTSALVREGQKVEKRVKKKKLI